MIKKTVIILAGFIFLIELAIPGFAGSETGAPRSNR